MKDLTDPPKNVTKNKLNFKENKLINKSEEEMKKSAVKPKKFNDSSFSEDSDGEGDIVDISLSDLEFPVGKKRNHEYAACISTQNLFINDQKGELRVMCVMCHLWAHNAGVGADKDIYVFNYFH
ncbi:hypothetical protein HHI36_002634 [Cryptolaemus montrouzieri]|uniref:Uncharacterized protein n=1 Tax=Cryptolaemus montrouzieri TaxID=559131 RepID=A0ABD2PB14_9CUCU